jgi:hypothetical protein
VSDDESLPPHAATRSDAVAATAASFQNFFMFRVSLVCGTSDSADVETLLCSIRS